jgi:hypothetical protein
MWDGELLQSACEVYRQDRALFLDFLAKCDDERLADVLMEDLIDVPLFRAPDDLVRIVLRKPRLCHDAVGRDPRALLDLLLHRRSFAPDIAVVLQLNPGFLTPDLRDAFLDVSPETIPLCYTATACEHCLGELLRRMADGRLPVLSLQLFEYIQARLQQGELVRCFATHLVAIARNDEWIRPLARFPKFFSALVWVADHFLSDAPEDAIVWQFVQRVVSAHLDYATIDFGEFCRFADLISKADRRGSLHLAAMSLSVQMRLWTLFCGHIGRATQIPERGLFFNLLKEFAGTAVVEIADDQSRSLVFRELVSTMLHRRSIELIDPTFRYTT